MYTVYKTLINSKFKVTDFLPNNSYAYIEQYNTKRITSIFHIQNSCGGKLISVKTELCHSWWQMHINNSFTQLPVATIWQIKIIIHFIKLVKSNMYGTNYTWWRRERQSLSLAPRNDCAYGNMLSESVHVWVCVSGI